MVNASSIEGSPTALVTLSTLLNSLAYKARSRKVKYLEPIPDPIEINKIVISIYFFQVRNKFY